MKLPTCRNGFLILGNLNVHTAHPAHEWLTQHVDGTEGLYLPPYSPEPKPTGYLNGDWKGEIQRGILPKDAHDLKRTVLGHSRGIQRSPALVRVLQ